MAMSTEKLARVTRVELDLAKSVFQVHGVDAKGEVVFVRKLRRGCAATIKLAGSPTIRLAG